MGADGLADLADEFIDFINSPEAKLESSSGANNNGGGGSGGGGSGGGGGGGGGAFKIKDDPKFSKYFRMKNAFASRCSRAENGGRWSRYINS